MGHHLDGQGAELMDRESEVFLATPATHPDGPRGRIRCCRVAGWPQLNRRRAPCAASDSTSASPCRGRHQGAGEADQIGRPDQRLAGEPPGLRRHARPDDQVVLEATTNTWAIVELVDLTLRLLDGLAAEVELAEGGIARAVVDDARVRHLLTIPGVGLQTAVGLVALVGNIGRFARPNKLVGYGGEPSGTPSVEQRSISCMASRRTGASRNSSVTESTVE